METNETLAASAASVASAIGNFSQPSDLPTQILLNHPNNTEFMVHSVVTVVSLSIVYGLLSLTAFVGNMLVIWVIYSGRRMHTVMNVYIGNLALADVIIAVFCIPFQFQAALKNYWDLPAFMCKLCPFLQHLSINVSIFTLVVIALDRYRGILWPLKGGYSKFRAKIHLMIVWFLATVVALPNLILFHLADHPHVEGKFGCIVDMEIFGGQRTWKNYTLVAVFVQYCVPLSVITFCHCHMAKVLWGTKTPGQANDQRDEVILANKRKVTKMLSIVVILFGICWLPYQTFNFLYGIDVALGFYGVNYIWMFGHILAMSNSCCNPFIYGIYNNKFKEELTRKSGSLFGRTATQPQDGGNDFEMHANNVPQREIHSENYAGHITENPIIIANCQTSITNAESTRTELRKTQSVKAVRFKSYSLRDKRLGTRV